MKAPVTTVQSVTTPYINLIFKDEDAGGNAVETAYKLCYDYNALARIEGELGRDLKSVENWKGLTSAKFATLVWCGLARYHKDVPLETVQNNLNPAIERQLGDQIFEMLFPGLLAALAEFNAEVERAKKIGAPSPNVQEPAAATL